MRVRSEFPDFAVTRTSLTDIFRNLPQWAGQEYLNFSVGSFRRQNWIDRTPERWKQRRVVDEGRAILVKRGALRRSIRMKHGADWFEIYTASPYAKIHNEGGRLEITAKMRRYFWAMHYKAKKRKNDELAGYWKNMALTKKTHFEISKRQFMGNSWMMNQRIARQVERGVARALRD